MTDRELLELAAKAAGYDIQGTTEIMICQPDKPVGFCILNERGGTSEWNPLNDDGDALRLAVKLEIDIEYKRDYIKACNYYANVYVAEKYNYDRLTATRWAIVLAAAEIGKNM